MVKVWRIEVTKEYGGCSGFTSTETWCVCACEQETRCIIVSYQTTPVLIGASSLPLLVTG